jgi:hypothetical protein
MAALSGASDALAQELSAAQVVAAPLTIPPGTPKPGFDLERLNTENCCAVGVAGRDRITDLPQTAANPDDRNDEREWKNPGAPGFEYYPHLWIPPDSRRLVRHCAEREGGSRGTA